jgi:hypothetical protein
MFTVDILIPKRFLRLSRFKPVSDLFPEPIQQIERDEVHMDVRCGQAGRNIIAYSRESIARRYQFFGSPRNNILWALIYISYMQIQRSGFDTQRYQIFWEVVGLERGPLSLVNTIEEALGRKNSGSGLESRSSALTTRHPSILESWH